MEAIGYGIIIGALIGLGMFVGGILVLQVKAMPNWQPFNFLNDKKEEEEIIKAGKRVKPSNYDEPPATAEEYHAKYERDGFHEELKHAPRD